MKPPVIESESMVLKPLSDAYAKVSWSMMASKPDYYCFYARKPVNEVGYNRMIKEDILKIQTSDEVVYNYEIRNAKSGLLGSINIYDFASLSWKVFHVYRGTGVATDAAKLMLTYLFTHTNKEYAQVVVCNEDLASIKIAEKLGFIKFAESHMINADGKILQQSRFNLFKQDFKEYVDSIVVK